jgi:hypothetical protein
MTPWRRSPKSSNQKASHKSSTAQLKEPSMGYCYRRQGALGAMGEWRSRLSPSPGNRHTKRIFDTGRKRTNYKLEERYMHKKSANAVRNIGLRNGQWWPIRLCAMRDGAYGEQEVGIHGQAGKEAYSVVVIVLVGI